MGRTKAALPKGSFSLKPTPNGQGECPVYLKYFVQNKYVKISTGEWVKPSDWDNKAQTVKSKHKSAARINNSLSMKKRLVDDQIRSYEGILTAEVVMKMLHGEYMPEDMKAKSILFIDYCNQVNDTLYNKGKITVTTHDKRASAINVFRKYLKEKGIANLALNQITIDVINCFISYKLNIKENKSRDGVNKSIAPIVKAVKYAQNNGLLPFSISQPIIDEAYLDLTPRTYDPDVADNDEVRFLSPAELESFKAYVPSSNSASRTREFMEMFLFAFYSCGLRFSDIVTLEWANIDWDNRMISKVQVKTKTKHIMQPRLSAKAIDILECWKKKNRNERFVFDLLPDSFQFGKETERDLMSKISAADKTINTSLKEIGKKLGFPFSLTFHVARHTFCVHAINAGISLHVVSQLMGHKSILATEKTYARYLAKTVDSELSKLDGIY